MTKRQAISKSELEVARIVWELQQATVREVLGNLPASRQIDYKTVQTFLRRLESKGYLASTRDGRSLVYRPTVQPNVVIQETVDDMITRLFNGQACQLLEHLLLEHNLDDVDLKRVSDIIVQVRSRALNERPESH